MAHFIRGIRCPECREQYPQGSGERVFASRADCPVCAGLAEGPFMKLPCGHLLCQLHFEALEAQELQVGACVAATQPGDYSRYSVVVGAQRERVAVDLENNCEHTWGLLRDRLSTKTRDPDDSDESDDMSVPIVDRHVAHSVDPGRVHLYVRGGEVNYSVEIPARDRDAASARVEETDSRGILESWREDGREEIANFVETKIAGLPVPGTLDGTGATDGHFPEVLRSIDRMTKRQRTRGSKGGQHVQEVLEVLREAIEQPGATCASVLKTLQEEFGA